MKKLILLLGIIRILKTNTSNTKYYFNFYNPLVWIMYILNPIVSFIFELIEFVIEFLKYAKRDFFLEFKQDFSDFKKYEKIRKNERRTTKIGK